MIATLGMPGLRRSSWLTRLSFVGLLACLGGGVAHAQSSTSTPAPRVPLAAEEAQALLSRIQEAARKLDYSGIFTYQQGELIQSSRLIHMVDGSGERERLEVLDGQPREYLRHNDDVQCLVPERKTVLTQQRRADRFPGLLLGSPAAVTRYYQVYSEAAPRRVAGRQCRMISIEPLDKARYGYRLCADDQNDLLLKAQTLSGGNSVIEQVTFTTLRLGKDVDGKLLESRWPYKDWKVQPSTLQPVDLASQGWRIPLPAGFVQVSQVARVMGQSESVSQLVLSDGLAAISVFIEPFDKKRNSRQPHGAYRRGAVSVYGTRIADYWLTVLGEVPPATLEHLAKSTEYVPPAAPAPAPK
ncbi:MucB/RseB C-terminal domain-containing protein [Bordetella sp. N]|uniref:MucB/RseB C-terminal domain-containing protein n=1 Tax=Bordetella sp. N TaxID=1746199 RepID=UPI00070C89C7|nr:MucB/RseB C-terminal domain-containing protein [Bordetella sp. N]ALM83947.1 siderophore-interacting protein [Bordetella sp. N]